MIDASTSRSWIDYDTEEIPADGHLLVLVNGVGNVNGSRITDDHFFHIRHEEDPASALALVVL